MFSYNKVVVRAAYEQLYQDTCNIIEKQEVENPDGSTTHAEVVVHEGIPCRISYKTDLIAGNTESASPLKEDIELFINPDIEVKPGSKLEITHLGTTTAYSRTGEPAKYDTHQEVHLELFKRWT